MASNLIFDIIANDNATKVVEAVGDAVSGQKDKWDSWKNTATVASGAVLAGMAGLAAVSIPAASDLAETVSKSSVIFDENQAAMLTWAERADTSLGLSKQAALESAASFGDMFSQIGFTSDSAAGMSTDVVQLAADLGSFNNLPTADVLDMISGGFRGEYDSLQKLLPNISSATVQQEALTETGKASVDQLTAQETATAFLTLAHKNATNAAGDFERTSGGLANQQKINAAEAQNLKASIGEQLLPAMTSLYSVGNSVLGWMNEYPGATQAAVVAVGALSAAVMIAAHWEGISTTARTLGTAAQWAWNAAVNANPIGLIIIAVAALVAAIVLLWQNNEGFRDWVIGAWDAIKGAFVAVWDWVSQNWPLLLEILTGPIGIAVVQIVQHWDSIKAAGAAAWQWIKDAWSSAGDFFSGVGQGVEEAFKMPFRAVATAWNNTVGQLSWTVPDWIPLIGGKTLTVPKIPMLADGGTALRAGLAIVGEAGPELISMPVGATVSPLNSRPSAGDSGVMRLHPDDMAVLAELLGEHVLAGARQVSSSTVTAAFRTATRGR